MALNRRADRPLSCPVLGVFLPRQPVTREAVDDPTLPFVARLRCGAAWAFAA